MSSLGSDIQVFISYTHDSDQHKERVASLKVQLWKDGVNCIYDGDEEAPPSGWPLWCEQQIQEADFVLVVCTQIYLQRYQLKEEPGRGLGGKWEGYVIRQELYEAGTLNTKYVPILFSTEDVPYIPIPLKGTTRYNIAVQEDYVKLYGRLTGQQSTSLPDRGNIREVPKRPIKPLFGEADPFRDVAAMMSELTAPDYGNTMFQISEGPVRFSFSELQDIIESLHSIVVNADPTSESQFDFSDMDIDKKNKLNGVGTEYYEIALRSDEIYVHQIRKFLQHPANQNVSELYHEIVDELRRKIATVRSRYDSFEQLLMHLADRAIDASHDRLRGSHKRTLYVLLSFMYLNCDIGRKE